MANRVLDTDVEEIIDVDSSVNVTRFIQTANTLINEILLRAGLSAAILVEIELWLSAHFVAMLQRQLTSEAIDDAKDTFVSKIDLGLRNSRYGQQAIALDSSGKLAALSGGKVARFSVVDPLC